jgi:hypothetical protein
MIPHSVSSVAAIVGITGAAVALAVSRIRFVGYEALRDAHLASEVRDEIALGRIPEARDRLRRASGPLARVLLAIFRFPYGVHREAVEMAWAESVTFERREHPTGGGSLPFLGAAGLAIGVATDVVYGSSSPYAGAPTFLGVLGACVSVGLWARLRRMGRRSAERMEAASAEIAALIVRFTESPEIVKEADGHSGEALVAVDAASRAEGGRPEVLHP